MHWVTWLLRVFTWDGVLPVCVIGIPWVIHWLLPNQRGVLEITAVVLPIVAFFLRAAAGHRHISTNNCPQVLRAFQVGVFVLAIFALLLVDCFLILSHVMPKVAVTKDDVFVIAAFVGGYLLVMAFAMYPGPPKELPEVLTF